MNPIDTVQHLVDRKGRLWQERVITVKPHPSAGYGFSLSGQRPVFVDSVVENGPACKAGIKAGDRIIKIDDQTVFDKKHPEVINLLKGATCVSLTVITQYSHRNQSELSGPQKIQDLTLNALKALLEKQQKIFEQLTIDYTKGPTLRIEEELKECEQHIKLLQAEISIKTNSTVEVVAHTTEASITSTLGPEKALDRQGRLARDDTALSHKLLSNVTNEELETCKIHLTNSLPVCALPPQAQPINTPLSKMKSPKMFRKGSISKIFLHGTDSNSRSRSSSPTKQVVHRQQSELNDSDLSDEDLEFAPRYTPFASLQDLNNFPAHMSIFLRYLIQNKDPRYLCFYLVAHSYQNHYKGSDLKHKALEILWTYCLPTSPLSVSLDPSICQRIFEILDHEENDMKLKSVFVESKNVIAQAIALDLSAYRHKRMLGLGTLYGEESLTNHMTSSRETDILTTTLSKILKDALSEKYDTTEDINRSQALIASIATFLMDATKGKPKIDSSILEKVQSFTKPDASRKKIAKIKKISKYGHSFQLVTFNRTTLCDHCDNVLWGITFQGYQCTTCEMNVHRHGCIDDSIDSCTGKKKENRRRSTFRRTSGGQQSNVSSSDLTDERGSSEIIQYNPQPAEGDNVQPDGDDTNTSSTARRRSISDPKQTLMGVHLIKEEGEVMLAEKENKKKISKSAATVTRTQSLKEGRPRTEGGTNPQTTQDTSLNTTPSWNSVASSSSVSDESLNATTATSTGTPFSVVRSSTLDTVLEGRARTSSPHLDKDVLQELSDADVEEELIPWRLTTKSEVVKSLKNFEIQRQELLKELIYTERTHLKKLMIMKHIYKNPLFLQGILTLQQVEMLFPSLDELVSIHSSFCSEMVERQAKYPDGVIINISDVLLQRFDGPAGERLCHACSVFSSNQVRADKLLKEFLSKNAKFKKLLQAGEANPYCNRRSLKDLLPVVWTRLTRYRLLIEQITKLDKKNLNELNTEAKAESEKLNTALDRIKSILNRVNRNVKQSENRQKLYEYQQKLDTTQLERTTHPIAEKYKDLNLTSENRVLLHEGTLSWKISHRKTVEVKALLLRDIFVILSSPEDGSDKLYLKRYHCESIGGGGEEEISAVIRLNEMILRHFASDKGGRSFLVLNSSNLMKLAQKYEFKAESVQEKKKWEDMIERAQKGTATITPDISSPTLEESFSHQIVLNPLMSNIALRDQLDKIDNGIQKLLDDKLVMLRALQGIEREDTINVAYSHSNNVADNASFILKTVGELTTQVSKLMVPNPAKPIVADVQYQLTELVGQLHTGLSGLLTSVGESANYQLLTGSDVQDSAISTTPQLDNISVGTTVSMTDQYMLNVKESTPNITPLPNGTHGSSLSITSENKKSSNEGEGNSDDSYDGGSPPPLPQQPPPSSSSNSSATPPEDNTLPIQMPRTNSETSMDWDNEQMESPTRLLAPPEEFNDQYMIATNILPQFTTDPLTTDTHTLTTGSTDNLTSDTLTTGSDNLTTDTLTAGTDNLTASSQILTTNISPHTADSSTFGTVDSPVEYKGFRRVSSNPTIKVMSVISSAGGGDGDISHPDGGNVQRMISDDLVSTSAVSEYVMTVHSELTPDS